MFTREDHAPPTSQGMMGGMRRTLDTLGREKNTAHSIKPLKNFKPGPRHVKWMQFLNLHGPLSTEYLHEYTIADGAYRNRTIKTLRRLFRGGMIYRPIDQFDFVDQQVNFDIYDISEKGKQYLIDRDLWVDAVRPSGSFRHQFMTATITATIHIMCERAGYRYIPPHEYLANVVPPVGHDPKKPFNKLKIEHIPFRWSDGATYRKSVIPDSVFAIDYGDNSFIAYALEADRNTEPTRPHSPDRKSDIRSIRQYAHLIGEKRYRDHFKRNAMMMLLYVTVSRGKLDQVMKLAAEEVERPFWLAGTHVVEFGKPMQPPALLTRLFEDALMRPTGQPFIIGKPPEKKAA